MDLDAVWLGFKHQIADIVFEDGIEVSENTLSQALKKAEEREELRKQIERLEKAINTEKQPRRKFALHQEIQKLRKKFSE